MPLISVVTSNPPPLNIDSFLKSLSTLLAHELGKPESYVMTALHAETPMTFAGTTAPTCFASIKSIGTFTPADTNRLSALLCSALSKGLDIPQNRIYIEFSNPPAHLWGFDGETFA